MSKIILFEYLSLNEVDAKLSDGFEPGKDDVSYLIEVAKQMPKTPEEIEDFAASYLASISWQALQRSNELKTRASVYCGYKKVDLDSCYGTLIASSEKPATITKEISKSDEKYVTLAKEHEKAKAYVEFYTGLMKQFEMCHYWAKSKEVSNNQEFKGSSYEAHDTRTSVKSEGEEEFMSSSLSKESHGSKAQKNTQVNAVEDVKLF